MIKVLLVAGFVLIPALLSAQLVLGLDPNEPILPDSFEDCKELLDEWTERILDLERQSKAVVDNINRSCESAGSKIECLHQNGCQGLGIFHERVSEGELIYDCRGQRPIVLQIVRSRAKSATQYESCSAKVRAKEAAERKKKEQEELRLKAEVEGKHKAEQDSLRDETDAGSNDRPAKESRAKDRTENEQSSRDRFESQMTQAAEFAQAQLQADFNARSQDRLDQLSVEKERGAEASQSFLGTLQSAKDRVDELVSGFKSLTGSSAPDRQPTAELASNSNVSNLLAGFNLGDAPRRESAESSVASVWEKMEQFRDFAQIASGIRPAPFASIPFAILEHVQGQTARTVDNLVRLIDNFDHATVQDTDAAFEGFRQGTFAPTQNWNAGDYKKAVVGWLNGTTEGYIQDRVTSEVFGRATGAAASLGSNSTPSRGPDGSIETPAMRIAYRQWLTDSETRLSTVKAQNPKYEPLRVKSDGVLWEFRLRPGANWMEVDRRGTPVLYDRNGKKYGWDAVKNQATYSKGDVSRLLVERGDLIPSLDSLTLRYSKMRSHFLPVPESQLQLPGRTPSLFENALDELNPAAPEMAQGLSGAITEELQGRLSTWFIDSLLPKKRGASK